LVIQSKGQAPKSGKNSWCRYRRGGRKGPAAAGEKGGKCKGGNSQRPTKGNHPNGLLYRTVKLKTNRSSTHGGAPFRNNHSINS